MQELTRRGFLKLSGLSIGTAIIGGVGFDISQAQARVREMKIANAKVTKSICPYCSVSCGCLIYTQTDGSMNVKPAVVHVEGNPDDPVNKGTLCPKGATLKDFINSPLRLKKPLYRPAGSDSWKEISWDEAIEKFARWVKDTRDKTFIEKDEQGNVVNRTEGFAWFIGSPLGNEEVYLSVKVGVALGTILRETQARI